MAQIWVCPLSRLEGTLRQTGARSVVTLLAQTVPLPPGIAAERHLWLDLSDIAEPLAGHVLPGVEHIDALLRFSTDWDRSAPLLIHCYAGVSRSTAAAFAVACALQPKADEAAIAAKLRAASPTATPNTRIVALADSRLGRSGRMVAAIRTIGRGVDCLEGVPFKIDIEHQDVDRPWAG